MTPYDRSLCRDALASAVVLVALTWAVMMAADEPMTASLDRVGRLCALLPLIGAAATLLVSRRADRRGELSALACVSVGRRRAVRGAVLGGTVAGLFGAVLVSSGRVPISVLFPRLVTSEIVSSAAGFVHPDVTSSAGDAVWHARQAIGAAALPHVAVVAVSLAMFAAALPMLAAEKWQQAWASLALLFLVATAMAGFHLAAVPGRAGWLFAAPAAALALVVLQRRRIRLTPAEVSR